MMAMLLNVEESLAAFNKSDKAREELTVVSSAFPNYTTYYSTNTIFLFHDIVLPH
jgi:hypothetical protein